MEALGAVIEAAGGKVVYERDLTVCKCSGCDDDLCLSRYCNCQDTDCSSLHLYFVEEKAGDTFYTEIYNEYKDKFISSENISLAIMYCDFAKHCIEKHLRAAKTRPKPKKVVETQYNMNFTQNLSPSEDPANSFLLPDDVEIDDDLEFDDMPLNTTFTPITDQVEDLFFQPDHSRGSRNIDSNQASRQNTAGAGNTFNESNLNTQPKACSNLDDLLDEMMDMGEVFEAPPEEEPVGIARSPPKVVDEENIGNGTRQKVPARITVDDAFEEPMIVDDEPLVTDNIKEPDINEPDIQPEEIQQEPEITRKEAPISLEFDGVLIEYDNLLKRTYDKSTVNFKRFKSKKPKFPRIIAVVQASPGMQIKSRRDFDFDD